jgi:hypothetical protein
VGSTVLDKDGVCAAAVAAELAVDVYKRGSTLAATLERIYDMCVTVCDCVCVRSHCSCSYGFHASCNGYYICHDPPTIAAIFDRLRKDAVVGGLMSSITSRGGCILLISPFSIRLNHVASKWPTCAI